MMTFFAVAGMVWLTLMAIRVPALYRESKIFVMSFVKGGGYTKLQARWVTFRWVILPSLGAAPSLVFLEWSLFYTAPSAPEIHEAAKAIDKFLKERQANAINEGK